MLLLKNNIVSSIKSRSMLQRILRFAALLLFGLVCLVLIITGYFYLDRDNIGRRVLMHTNKLANGELSFREISFDPVRHFPDISLLLKDVEYYENPVSSRNQNEKAVFEMERLFAALDIRELLRGKIKVGKISLRNGDMRLVRYPDSTLNMLNAFRLSEQQVETPQDSSDIEPDFDLDLDLDQISLIKVSIEFDDRVERDLESLMMKKLIASFSITPETIRSNVYTDMELKMIRLSDKLLFRNKELELETAIEFRREAGILEIQPSTLSIDRASMNIAGEIDFKKNDKFNIQVDGSDHDFSIFQLLLSKEGLKNLKQGDLYFRGDIRSVPGQEIPLADFSFGLEDVNLYVPRAKDYIRELNLSGKFNSGTSGDLSSARLDIDTVLAKLPSGHLNAVLHMENFLSPEIDLIWDMAGSLSGLEKLIKVQPFDTLAGEIETQCSLLGARFDPDSNIIVADVFRLKMNCEDLSISIPDLISIQRCNGNIYNDKDTLWLEDLDIRTGNTDFLINGVVYNAFYLPARVEQDIRADLQIQSGIFDMPEFLSFVPAIREDFPYRIRDIDLDLELVTSTSKMLDFETNPYMDFTIRHLDATIEDFLPRISDLSGNFILSEKYRRTFLDFRNFEIGMLESTLLADLELHSPAKKRNFILMEVQTEDLNPGEIFWGDKGDSIPDFLNGLLNGSFRLDIHFPHDGTTRLKKVDLQEADLHFINVRDTFETNSLNLIANDVFWNNEPGVSPMKSLEAGIQLSMEKLMTDHFEVDDLEYDIEIRDGVFNVSTEKTRLFAKAGSGAFTLAPFAELPYYKLNYEVDGFQAPELLMALKTDTVLSGTMDINIDLSVEGRDKEALLNSLDGYLNLYGRDLLLYGIDLDEVIKKFKRSQNFNLVDLGAVMFAGPAGLALTKGGSYAAMLVTNFGDTSHVTEMVSDWEFKNGTILLRDVAFATEESRVAAKGWLDFQKDSLDISFAVIDKKGCNVIGQDLYGSTANPEKSNIQLISTLLAPVTNLLELTLGIECEAFYEGRIKHPDKK